ncbi:MAG: hypothetical protein K6G42_08070, partial [Lachnospiraceae bacterium]|nr:hypothetical protein [Lachnospiraceae bacterium]
MQNEGSEAVEQQAEEETTATPKAEESGSETVEETVTEEAVTEEAKADDERPEDPWVSSQTEYPQLQVDWTMNEERTNNKTVIYEGHFEEVLLTDESSKKFPELARAMKNEADTERSDYQKEEEQIIKDAGERF